MSIAQNTVIRQRKKVEEKICKVFASFSKYSFRPFVYEKLNAHFRSCHGCRLVRFLVKFVHVYMVYVFTVAFEAANVNMGEE